MGIEMRQAADAQSTFEPGSKRYPTGDAAWGALRAAAGECFTGRALHGLAVALLVCCAGCGTICGETVDVDGTTRSYRLHTPPAYSPDADWPLVIALHPFTGSGRSMERMTQLNAVADAEGFIVAYPDGLRRSWNYGYKSDEPDDVKFILALVDEIAETYTIDEDRVFLTGASNGASMTYRMMCEAGDRFAGAAVVMGATMPREIQVRCASAGSIPLLLIHGTEDPILPWEGGDVFAGPGEPLALLSVDESVAYWRTRNGCDAEADEVPIEDSARDGTTTTISTYPCPVGTPVVLYTVEEGGHTWPGDCSLIPRFIVGKTSRDFSASEALWDFFEPLTRTPAQQP